MGLGSVVGLGLAFGLDLRLGLVSGLYKWLFYLATNTSKKRSKMFHVLILFFGNVFYHIYNDCKSVTSSITKHHSCDTTAKHLPIKIDRSTNFNSANQPYEA